MGLESTLKLLNVCLSNHVFIALTLLTGLFIVFMGRRYAGHFRWYHLGWGLVVMGLFGIPSSVQSLCFGPLETLLTALLLHLRLRGPDKMLEALSFWPEDIDNLLLCGLGILILVLGAKTSHKPTHLP